MLLLGGHWFRRGARLELVGESDLSPELVGLLGDYASEPTLNPCARRGWTVDHYCTGVVDRNQLPWLEPDLERAFVDPVGEVVAEPPPVGVVSDGRDLEGASYIG